MKERLIKQIKIYYRLIKQKSKQIYIYFGHFLILIGEAIIGQRSRGRYRLISNTIENVLLSQDIQIVVTNYKDYPLFVRFFADIHVKLDKEISEQYFIYELSSQLGIEPSDIAVGNGEKSSYVDITNTAISSLEKGTTRRSPKLFKNHRIEGILN